jgi:hypothetical protein
MAQLVRALTLPDIQMTLCPLTGYLPVQEDAWHKPIFANDENYGILYQALQTGRPFPLTSLWGAIEDKFMKSLSLIWTDLFDQPDPELSKTISKHLNPLACRLNMILEGQ